MKTPMAIEELLNKSLDEIIKEKKCGSNEKNISFTITKRDPFYKKRNITNNNSHTISIIKRKKIPLNRYGMKHIFYNNKCIFRNNRWLSNNNNVKTKFKKYFFKPSIILQSSLHKFKKIQHEKHYHHTIIGNKEKNHNLFLNNKSNNDNDNVLENWADIMDEEDFKNNN